MVATMPSMSNSKQSIHSSTIHQADNKTIACTICSAQYTPTQAHAYLLQASPLALESAFMSMCHFCFRCRRPACPLCWDDVHGLCGACVEDVHLPFRQEAEALPFNSQLLIPASPRPQERHAPSFPLVAIQPGRFQSDLASVEASEEATVDIVPDVQPNQEKQDTSVREAVVPVEVQQTKHIPSIAKRIERVLTLVLGLILLVIAVLVVVASFSQQANEAILHILHVDIRMEIGYLLQLIQQFHFGG